MKIYNHAYFSLYLYKIHICQVENSSGESGADVLKMFDVANRQFVLQSARNLGKYWRLYNVEDYKRINIGHFIKRCTYDQIQSNSYVPDFFTKLLISDLI